jgi:hypothetical protein
LKTSGFTSLAGTVLPVGVPETGGVLATECVGAGVTADEVEGVDDEDELFEVPLLEEFPDSEQALTITAITINPIRACSICHRTFGCFCFTTSS